MRNLRSYFSNPFDSKEIGDAELSSFAEDHLDRLSAANAGGAFSETLAATRAALEAFTGATGREDAAANQRLGMTGATAAARDAFAGFASRKEGVIRDALGGTKTSPGYLEFYPAGINEYHKASLEVAEARMTRFVEAAKRYESPLGKSLFIEAEKLKTAYVDARGSQLSKKGTVSAEKSAARAARAVLTAQLAKNLLKIASENVGHPERLSVYFDQTRLRD